MDLSELRPIHLPDPISLWPPAIGWWILGFLILCVLLLCFFLLRATFRWNQRKHALALFEAIEHSFKNMQDGHKCVAELSGLLRRVAVTREKGCAGLTGDAWLKHLDRTLPQPEFSRGIGQLLIEGPYQKQVDRQQVPQLLNLCRRWLKRGR